MIKSVVVARQLSLTDADIEICQKVFDQLCFQKGIAKVEEREHLAAVIVEHYLGGVANEASLMRLFQ